MTKIREWDRWLSIYRFMANACILWTSMINIIIWEFYFIFGKRSALHKSKLWAPWDDWRLQTETRVSVETGALLVCSLTCTHFSHRRISTEHAEWLVMWTIVNPLNLQFTSFEFFEMNLFQTGERYAKSWDNGTKRPRGEDSKSYHTC